MTIRIKLPQKVIGLPCSSPAPSPTIKEDRINSNHLLLEERHYTSHGIIKEEQMELSLSMWSVHRTVKENGWVVRDFLEFCSKEGIKQVELLNVFWKNAAVELPEAVALMKNKGIRASSYAVANDFAKENADERKAALQEILDAIPVAQALDVKVIRVFSGNLTDQVTYDKALEWIVEGLSAAAEAAGKAGITLCLENHGKLAGSGVQVKAILDRVNSPYLKSTFDTGNFLLVDEKPLTSRISSNARMAVTNPCPAPPSRVSA
jgi:sugar phosphate isomerase/epimerase